MRMELEGRAVLVAGGAQGIGRAISAAFAGEGARVAILDVSAHAAVTAEELSAQTGATVEGRQVDATDFAAVLRAADAIGESIGALDHLVCAVGAGSGKIGFPFWNVPPSDWQRVLDVNLMSAVHMAHAFAPGMAERRHGSLLFLASIAGQIGSQTDPPYSASKAAVINFVQCIARDLAAFGVRANALCPGMVQTALNRSVWRAWWERQPEAERMDYEAWGQDKVSRVAPLGRWQQPEEIAAMALFLASPHAANITGQTLNVDGGQVMHA